MPADVAIVVAAVVAVFGGFALLLAWTDHRSGSAH